MAKGVFISFEGGDGVGKSTQIKMLAAALKKAGRKVMVTREPGGTSVGEKLRTILKSQFMHPRTELLIFEASRAELIETVIRPKLKQGWVILSDRFEESSIVYQGHVRGLLIADVKSANQLATSGCRPQRIILLDPKDFRWALAKRNSRKNRDRFERESSAFHKRVEAMFRKLAAKDRRFRVYDACLERKAIHARILKDTLALLKTQRH